MKINELYGKHKEDVYIIGSGPTMDYFDKKFFEDRITITLNNMYKYFPCNYMITHHHEIVQKAINSGLPVITSEYCTCNTVNPRHNFTGEYYVYTHTNQGYTEVDLSQFGVKIGSAGTPAVAALQIAYLMGATNIILCGCDGGSLDGLNNYSAYREPSQVGHPGRVQKAIEKTANRIRQEGVGVYSIIPFVNPTFEGHEFKAISPEWGEPTEAEQEKLRLYNPEDENS